MKINNKIKVKQIFSIILILLLPFLFVFSIFPIPQVNAIDVPFTMNSGWAATSPIIDGNLDNLYLLNGGNKTWHFINNTMVNNYVYFLNNATHLFIYLDLTGDTTGWLIAPIIIHLDTNNSKQLVSCKADCFFYMDLQEVNFLLSPATLEYSENVSFGTSNNSVIFHTQIEIAFNMTSMRYTPRPGDTIGFLIEYGTNNDLVPDEFLPFDFYVPIGGSVLESDESSYAELVLASAPTIPPLDLTLLFQTLIIIGTASITAIATVLIIYILQRKGILSTTVTVLKM